MVLWPSLKEGFFLQFLSSVASTGAKRLEQGSHEPLTMFGFTAQFDHQKSRRIWLDFFRVLLRARSSEGEHHFCIVGVASSILAGSTTIKPLWVRRTNLGLMSARHRMVPGKIEHLDRYHAAPVCVAHRLWRFAPWKLNRRLTSYENSYGEITNLND